MLLSMVYAEVTRLRSASEALLDSRTELQASFDDVRDQIHHADAEIDILDEKISLIGKQRDSVYEQGTCGPPRNDEYYGLLEKFRSVCIQRSSLKVRKRCWRTNYDGSTPLTRLILAAEKQFQ